MRRAVRLMLRIRIAGIAEADLESADSRRNGHLRRDDAEEHHLQRERIGDRAGHDGPQSAALSR